MSVSREQKPEEPQPTVISSTTLQRQFGAILRRCFKDGEQFIVERNGLPVFAILSVRDYERVTQPARDVEPDDRPNR